MFATSDFGIRSATRTALVAALGPQCALCGRAGAEVCSDCSTAASTRERRVARCPRCAEPGKQAACATCLRHPPDFARAICGLAYEPPVDAIERGLKFGGRTAWARPLAHWLAQAIRRAGPPLDLDLLIPVPLARERMAERGYNQAGLIAQALARELALVSRCDILSRVHATPALTRLDAAQRSAAVRGAFASAIRLDGLRIGLVDDVMTTGATLRAAAHALRAAGAQEVIALAALRTPPRGNDG